MASSRMTKRSDRIMAHHRAAPYDIGRHAIKKESTRWIGH